VASVAAQTKGILSQLFSPSGLGGVSVTVEGVLYLRQEGAYSPTTGKMSSGLYWDTKTSTYSSQTPPRVPLIQKPAKARETDWGQTVQTRYLIQPISGVSPKSLVGAELEVQGTKFQIMEALGTSLGADQIIWELGCQ